MASLTDLLQKVFLVVSSVDKLEAKIKKMDEMLLDHHERIVRLEGSADLIAEKAKNAALQGAQASSTELLKEIFALKARLGDAQHVLRAQIASAATGASKGNSGAAE